MEWMININKLTPEQRYFFESEFNVTNPNRSNHWIQGPVGSGKTVVLVHTINKVYENNPGINACIVVFTHALIDLLRTGLSEEIKNRIPVYTYHEFRKLDEQFDTIFVDEIQDIAYNVLGLLKQRSNHLIVAGDAVQSIYDEGCAPATITELTGTRPYELRTVHRLTNKIIQIASAYLNEPDLLLNAPRGRMANVDVVKHIAQNLEEEVGYIYEKAEKFAEQGYSTAILIPSHKKITEFFSMLCNTKDIDTWDWRNAPNDGRNRARGYEEFNDYIIENGLKIQYLGNGFGSLQRAYDENLINVMTYHSVKGLDFQAVFIPFLSYDLEIWRNDQTRENTLFFVALTRSRQNLFLSHTGNPHHLVQMIPEDLIMDDGNGEVENDLDLYDKDDLPF